MYKASRTFIDSRQKHSPSFKLLVPNNVVQLGTGEPNQCFLNSHGFVNEKKEQGQNYVCLSGWLVGPYDNISNSTEFVQHWWVGDRSGNHFDTTPHHTENFEYILDMAIYYFAQKNYDRIKSCVAMSILNKNGSYYLLRNSNDLELELEEIPELKTELLFKYI
jgi:hypothetical protein